MAFPHALTPLAQQRQADAESGVGGLRAGDRLKQQVHRRTALQASQLRRDVGQAARLRRHRQRVDEAIQPAQNGRHRFDRFRRRIDADHGVAAAVQQAIDGGQENAAEIVGGVIRLHADAEDAALAHRVAAARDVADLARRQHEILVAHQLGRSRSHVGMNGSLNRADFLLADRIVEQILAELANGQTAQRLKCRSDRACRAESD